MRYVIYCLLSSLAVSGCAGPQKAISLQVSDIPPALVILDQRPDVERKNKLYASCSNHGRGWNGVEDGAFDPSRIAVLSDRLSAGLGDKLKKATVKHFQNCYLIRSASGAAGLAGISYALAVAVEAAYKRGDDLTMTYIVLDVDGKGWTPSL